MKLISLRTKLLPFLLFGLVSFALAKKSAESLISKKDLHKNLTITEYNIDVKGKNRWVEQTIVYNSKGLKVDETKYAKFGMRERIIFEYDANDRCLKEVIYDEKKKVSRIRKYDYNADGTKHTQYNYLPNGRLYSTKVYQYTY